MSEEKLEPCPKCGSDVRIKHAHGCKYVFCDKCGIQSTRYYEGYDEDVIAKEWNSRPIEDALKARVKELEGALNITHDELNHLADKLNELDELNQTDKNYMMMLLDWAREALKKKGGK